MRASNPSLPGVLLDHDVHNSTEPRNEASEAAVAQQDVLGVAEHDATMSSTNDSVNQLSEVVAYNNSIDENPSVADNSHKRKHSLSQEPTSPIPQAQYARTPLKDMPSHDTTTTSREGIGMPPPIATPRTYYSELPKDSGTSGTAEYTRSAQWYAQQTEAQTPISAHMSSDEQLIEALRQDNQGQSQGQGSHSPIDYSASPNGDAYHEGQEHANMSQVQRDEAKKRKRNFSNRTKTGCMTCRRRKKKCDETRPECNNCLRGGFSCNGYPSRSSWPKSGESDSKGSPLPLQAKDGYDVVSPAVQNSYGTSPGGYNHPPAQRRDPTTFSRSQALPRVDTQPIAHHHTEDRTSAGTLANGSSDNRMSGISYAQTSPFPTPVSAQQDSYEYHAQTQFKERRPPQHESEINAPQSAHSGGLPPISMLNPHAGASTHPLSQTTSVQDAARLALALPVISRTQKQEMLSGGKFYPFDKELVLERERCSANCHRFNGLSNPNNGVGLEERARIFADILQPKSEVPMSPSSRSPINLNGRVGRGVIVEAPFTCDYGYNIHIGDDVSIGKSCTILDSCEVRIGDRVVIGPNVQLYTEFLSTEPSKRLGNRGPHQGDAIIIEDDCWIGGNVTILPGRTIKRGATVGAGSVVTRDVPSHTVVCGNPARVVRGLYSEIPRD